MPQGSVLSSTFCSLHYATRDHAHLARYLASSSPSVGGLGSPVGGPNSSVDGSEGLYEMQLQMRLIDDTLHVSTAPAPFNTVSNHDLDHAYTHA